MGLRSFPHGTPGFVVASVMMLVVLMASPAFVHAITPAPWFGESPGDADRFAANRQLAAFFAVACPVALVVPAWLARCRDRWVLWTLIAGVVVGGPALAVALVRGRARGVTGPATLGLLIVHGGVVALAAHRMAARGEARDAAP